MSSVYWEYSGAIFNADGKELFWSQAINEGRTPWIMVVLHMKERGIWTGPKLASFNTSNYTHINSVFHDGTRFFFYSGDRAEWFVNKTETGWSEPQKLEIIDCDKLSKLALWKN